MVSLKNNNAKILFFSLPRNLPLHNKPRHKPLAGLTPGLPIYWVFDSVNRCELINQELAAGAVGVDNNVQAAPGDGGTNALGVVVGGGNGGRGIA